MGNDANGFLLPSWYVAEQPTDFDLGIASSILGFSLACAVFTFVKALRQTWKMHRRGKVRNAYIIMVWAEWLVCVIISIVSWLYLSTSQSVLPGFWLFFWLLVLWVVQIQCILQIIINRVRLLMVDQGKADYLKWGFAIFIGLIQISVFIIWIPARLQISQQWIDINTWWDRVEKTLFALCDIGLNVYFIYLVQSKFIANGLTKYKKLIRYNVLMICVSMSLDAILIGMMSLPNTAMYIQFHPVAYLVKLYIEMNVSDLIAKIVKSSNQLNEHDDTGDNMVITSSVIHSNCSPKAVRKKQNELKRRVSMRRAPELQDTDEIIGGKLTMTDVASKNSPDLEAGPSKRRVSSTDDGDKAGIIHESTMEE